MEQDPPILKEKKRKKKKKKKDEKNNNLTPFEGNASPSCHLSSDIQWDISLGKSNLAMPILRIKCSRRGFSRFT
jgi:hypothetical protein